MTATSRINGRLSKRAASCCCSRGPGLPIGRTPEAADGARLLVEDRLDRRAAQRLRPIRRLEAAPHPELDRERLLRISLIVGADLGQRPVDDVVGADLRLRRGLQLLPAGDHHESAEDAGLGVERFQRIDRIAAVADEAIGAHRDQPADRRLDVLGRAPARLAARAGRQQASVSRRRASRRARARRFIRADTSTPARQRVCSSRPPIAK